MTAQQKQKILNRFITPAALVGALGWGWSQLDTRFVHTATYQQHITIDSISRVRDSDFQRQLLLKVDSINLRVQQIQCGRRVLEGCR